MNTFCIHGNFQAISVWQPLIDRFSSESAELKIIAEDLYAKPFQAFDDWTENFCNRAESQAKEEKSVLVGYSLGGRLALHACVHRPDLWHAVIVIGADPGLESEEEKRVQLDRDRNWAERLKREPLEKLVDEWDAQPVFCAMKNTAPRNLDELDVGKLGQQFEVFSKGLQQNLVPELAELKNPPVLFLSGEKDKKYQEIGDELAKLCPMVESRLIADAGHRVPWENHDAFISEISVFIDSVLNK